MSKRIVIIEDDLDTALVLAARLKTAGYETRIARDGVAGTREAHAFKPDLVILDVMLPAGGGVVVLRRLRMSTHTSHVPVLLLTGIVDDTTLQPLRDLGVAGCVQKPYDPAQLLAEVKLICG